jgi:hypothetical protein
MRKATVHARRERDRRANKRTKTEAETFLSRLLSLECKQAKRAMIQERNPFFYTFFGGQQ